MLKSKYEKSERWWAEKQKEYKIKAQAETILATIIEERKLPPIVDIMLEKCLRKEMVLPEYVEMTHEVLKKWWVHRHEPQEYEWEGYRLGDCDDLKVSTTSQRRAEHIWGIKRCLPCSIALALIQDLRSRRYNAESLHWSLCYGHLCPYQVSFLPSHPSLVTTLSPSKTAVKATPDKSNASV